MQTRRKRKRISAGYLNQPVTLYGKSATTVNSSGRPIQTPVVLLQTWGELFGPPRGTEGLADNPDASRTTHRLRIRNADSLDVQDIESAVVNSYNYNVIAAQEDVSQSRNNYTILHLENITA